MHLPILPKCLLVIAKSARMLVQMCVDAGCDAVAIDCFADSDTRHMAMHTMKVSSLALAEVLTAVESVRQVYGVVDLLYGSGFESHPETLAYLEKHWRIIGNTAATFQQVQDKREFFARLGSLSIPHPLVAFTQPDDNRDWLLKPWRGEGGLAIRCSKTSVDGTNGYWQQFLEGRSMSVLFAASRNKVELIGFNEQWTVDLDSRHAFMFAGITSHAEVSDNVRRQMAEWLAVLSATYGLQGLNSLDFIIHDGSCYVLEINARISASAQLYGKAMLLKQMQACLGRLDDSVELSSLPSAYKIVYAQKPLSVPAGLTWPEWAVDRPNPGTIVATGEPICSIIATGKNSRQVLENLHQQQLFIENILETGR